MLLSVWKKKKLSQEEEEASTVEENMNRCRAFVELVGYIEKSVESGTSFFKLTEIHFLYVDRLNHFGISKEVHKARLKERLLEHFPEAQEQHDGRNIIISFTAALWSMLREAVKKRNFSEDDAVLAKAASLVRTDIFNQTSARFTGCFPQKCQEHSLPSSLKFLISLILNGPSLTDQNRCETQACLTVGQAIVYNTKKRAPSSNDV